VLVGKDFLTRWPDHYSCLRPVDSGSGSLAERPVGDRTGNTHEAVLIAPGGSFAGPIIARQSPRVFQARQQVRPVGVVMALQCKCATGSKLPARAGPFNHHAGRGLLLHADLGNAFVVVEYLLQPGRLGATAAINAVEPGRIVAGVLVQL